MIRSLLLSLLCLFFSGFKKAEPPCAPVKLHQLASFAVGTALNTEKLKYEERYWTTALEHFNSFTPEKVLKAVYVQPREGQFYFTELDHLMAFCKKREIRLHGHTLVWHKSLPLWMERFRGDSAAWDRLLKVHIQTVVNHCKNYVKSWDVVNEAFNDDGSMRETIWLKNIGPTYIEKAFLYAAEADPDAVLFYNDYSLEHYSGKLTAVLSFLGELRKKNIPVHGIGMQMHVSLDSPLIENINRSAAAIEKEGLLVHYSELDVNLGDQPFFVSRKKLQRRQQQRIKEIVEGYLQLKPATRFGITLWGVSDNDSWLSDDRIRSRPLLFDNRYRPKPAFCGFVEGLNKKY